jgi:hypothetical protein
MSAETSNQPERSAALTVIAQSPGISTIDLLDRLRLEVVADSLAWLHAQGRIVGFGQDLDGRWWTVDDNPVIAREFREDRPTPAHRRFLAAMTSLGGA